MDGVVNLENTLFVLHFVSISLDLEARQRYNYYVSYVNRKDLL